MATPNNKELSRKRHVTLTMLFDQFVVDQVISQGPGTEMTSLEVYEGIVLHALIPVKMDLRVHVD
jgi:hypothetical protein